MSLHFKNNNPSSHNILVVHLKVVLKWKDTYIENIRVEVSVMPSIKIDQSLKMDGS